MNMIKVMWCRFQQCLGTFTMLLFEGSSKMGFFRHLSNHVFRVRSFGNIKAMRGISVSKRSKFKLDFKNGAKSWENVFSFSDNCIWIGIVILSLLRTGYFWLAANLLTRNFWYDADFNSAWTLLPCWLSKGPLKQDFSDIYLSTFLDSVISEIQKLWGSTFFSRCVKFNLDFRNTAKNWAKNFCYLDNCIWIGIVKLCHLRTGYFSSAANVLTSSPKIWHVNKRDFFQLNFLGSDRWIW